jgi:glutamate racemase
MQCVLQLIDWRMDDMDSRPIGILDSGFGGLTVLDECVSQMPHEQFVYFGDTLRSPYGTKAPNEVIDYSIQSLKWFEKRDVKCIIVSCNTISSVALPNLKSMSSTPIFGMIDSSISTVLSWSELTGIDINSLGIIGTKNTISSRIHENRFRTEGFTGNIYPVTTSIFFPLLVEGISDKTIWNDVFNYYLSRLRDSGIEGLLLGSTSYSLIMEYLQEYFGGTVQIFDPNFMLVKKLASYLSETDSEHEDKTKQKRTELYITGSYDTFVQYYKRFFHFDYSVMQMLSPADL